MAKDSKSLKNWLKEAGDWALRGSNRAKFIFLLISVFLWLLIKLSKPGYVKTLSFPVEYENLPADQILMNEPPQRIKLRMRANGFTLLKYSLGSFKTLEVDLEPYAERNEAGAFWLPDRNFLGVETQFNEEAQILDISPDTVEFVFSTLETKRVPVALNLQLSENSPMKIYGTPLVNPDSVELVGPPELLREIETVESYPYKIPLSTEDSLKLNLPLKKPAGEQIEMQVQQVKVLVNLSRITEDTLEVPVQIRNKPDSIGLEIFPKKINLTYRVALKDYHRVQTSNFFLTVDYREVAAREEARFMTVQVEDKPAFVQKTELNPKRVEFIITKR